MGFVFACPLRVWAGFVWPLSLSLAISACLLFCVQPALSRFLLVGGSFRGSFFGRGSCPFPGTVVRCWFGLPPLSPLVCSVGRLFFRYWPPGVSGFGGCNFRGRFWGTFRLRSFGRWFGVLHGSGFLWGSVGFRVCSPRFLSSLGGSCTFLPFLVPGSGVGVSGRLVGLPGASSCVPFHRRSACPLFVSASGFAPPPPVSPSSLLLLVPLFSPFLGGCSAPRVTSGASGVGRVGIWGRSRVYGASVGKVRFGPPRGWVWGGALPRFSFCGGIVAGSSLPGYQGGAGSPFRGVRGLGSCASMSFSPFSSFFLRLSRSLSLPPPPLLPRPCWFCPFRCLAPPFPPARPLLVFVHCGPALVPWAAGVAGGFGVGASFGTYGRVLVGFGLSPAG